MKKRILRASPVLVMLVLVTVGWFHRFWLFDTYRSYFYEPSATVEQLANRSGMSEHGRRLFYGGQPELLSGESFSQECQFADLGLVLGCYKSADIFILDVDEDELEPVEPVTAAHEMLHVHYARISIDEERQLEELLDRQLELVTNQRVLDEIDGYKKDPNADLYNEMHSIFGTELAELIPELEEHYAQFFDDRSLVVAESDTYEAVFIALEDQIEEFDAQLASLGERIDTLESEIDNLNGQITSDRARLQSLLDSNQIEQYNASVPGFNSLVNSHNSKVEQVKTLIAQFNEIVEERNDNVAAKNNLIKSLDSDLQTIE